MATLNRIAILAIVAAALLFNPIHQRLTVLGVLRGQIRNIHGVDSLRVIPGTAMCEDLHHEKTTNHLFASCQLAPEQRVQWFPPLLTFVDHKATDGGALVRVNPVSMTSANLKLKGFPGPMTTHGIDILNDPEDPSLLWIYAVNHLPNPARWDVKPQRPDLPFEIGTIEIFTHRLGTDEAEHVRSVQHPSIRMPNDLLAISPSSFYVTNDHANFEGAKRTWEDVGTQHISPTPDTVFVELTDLKAKNPAAGVVATTALRAIHNNNGLGHGSPHTPGEVAVVDAAGGVMARTIRDASLTARDRNLTVIERIQLQSTLDNPSYYEDLYATAANNASGYILAGLGQGHKVAADFPVLSRPIPSLVWHVRANEKQVDPKSAKNSWEKRLVFQDDGKTLRSASGAVLIGIDPKENQGKKQGWLFVTGFGSLNMVAAKIDL